MSYQQFKQMSFQDFCQFVAVDEVEVNQFMVDEEVKEAFQEVENEEDFEKFMERYF